MNPKFALPGELVKGIANLFFEVGPTTYINFEKSESGYLVRFTTMDASKTTMAIVEVEPSVVMEGDESASIAFDTDFFKRVANAVKREELTFEIREEALVITAASPGFTKEFEIPALLEEPPKVSRAAILDRINRIMSEEGRTVCIVTLTSEFLREAINTLKKTIKPDTLSIEIHQDRVIISAPGALQKVRLVGILGTDIQEINCPEEAMQQFYPFEPIEAFAKNIKGAIVRMYITPGMPMFIDAELAIGANVGMIVSARSARGDRYGFHRAL